MRLRTIALAALPAAFLGVMASAPTASAWASGNCPQNTFCVWPEFWYGDTDMPPSLATQGEWSGSARGHIFYNNTSRDVTMTYVVAQDEGQGTARTACVSRGQGSYFTVPMSVTKVTWREDDGSPCW
ncbi:MULTISPECIES: hypothetical protein [unclassified Streptomyces]|uniref:hypothetical protein n=1 Tax=unclassified Streptomyces TaxID=2593676 RepID=UPI0001C1BFA9|nr:MULTISPECIES: hypothetical protein [unclassified Streptomyces]AEN08084.1 conserved hypothetical protein [Streptomyces sp. SirexAA-E]MYR68411.1 hypothetical protein [Streptomyces sp. SID4939]MYS02115.1 hypothetical protein [Streptomyces sp. SID4940]MYT66766.1 hypothetical protein [Streptomyces sp. SID8357]MYT83687.1 hypothetical protein [Streptomyces sp. SID8360]